MPDFVTKRWYRSKQVMVVCFVLFLLSIYHWIFGLLGVLIIPILFFTLYRTERISQKDWQQYILHLTRRIRRSKQFAIESFPVGILLYNQEKKIVWHNSLLAQLMDQKTLVGLPIKQVFPKLTEETQFQIDLQGKTFQVSHQPELKTYYFQDLTQLVELTKKYEQEQVVLGYLHLDNLDEIDQGMSEQDETLLINQVYSKISLWAQKYDLAFKRYDEDKIFFVTRKEKLEKMIESEFEILDEIRDLTRKNKIPYTLSIGVAGVGNTVQERSKNAFAALNIALARGGDQAAVQDQDRILFFGGKVQAVEKRTRVRARVVSHAISNLMQDHKRVLIMGHQGPDMDSLGAAIGMAKCAQVHDCEARIILNERNASIDKLIELLYAQKSFKNLFIPSEKAFSWVEHSNTLLVLVDTHKPTFALDPKLLQASKKVVVIDHHRRGEEFIKDPVLVYIEPYASSTCELVTEILEYQDQVVELHPLEASALLAGIVVDTKRFAFHTGARTFEAASYLRRQGADLTMVQTFLKEDMDRFLKRGELIKNAELLYNGTIAIAVGKEDELYDQLMIAQTADTLLNLHRIVASFVVAKREDHVVSVSARSQGDLNVQFIMEKLGGGGHFTNAAMQIQGKSLSEVKEQLIQAIEQFVNREGEES